VPAIGRKGTAERRRGHARRTSTTRRGSRGWSAAAVMRWAFAARCAGV